MSGQQETFIVIVRAIGKPGKYVLASNDVFDDFGKAADFAGTFPIARGANVVSGDFAHLHSAPTSAWLPIERIARIMFPSGDLQNDVGADEAGGVCDLLAEEGYAARAFEAELRLYLDKLGIPGDTFEVAWHKKRGRVVIKYGRKLMGISEFVGDRNAMDIFDSLVGLKTPITPDKVWTAIITPTPDE